MFAELRRQLLGILIVACILALLALVWALVTAPPPPGILHQVGALLQPLQLVSAGVLPA